MQKLLNIIVFFRFTIFNSEDSQEEAADSAPHPILDSAKIEFSAPVEEFGLSLDCKVEIFGSDVMVVSYSVLVIVHPSEP